MVYIEISLSLRGISRSTLGGAIDLPKFLLHAYFELRSPGSQQLYDPRPPSLNPKALRWTPHPVIVAIRDNRDYNYQGPLIFLLYHYYRVGGPPNKALNPEATTLTSSGLFSKLWALSGYRLYYGT